jgi:hypothetical protein
MKTDPSTTRLKDIVFETDRYWVKRVPKGFEVYKTGLTHSTRVAIIGYTGDKGLQRAKLEIERREAASGPSERHHATKKKPSRGRTAPLAPLGPPRSKAATVLVYSRPSGYWYAQALDATTGARITDASGYSREDVLRALRGKFAMIGVTIKSITDEDPYVAGHHATKKSAEHEHDPVGHARGVRAREIVRLAAEQIKDPSARYWLLADERGTFEKAARKYLEETADKARTLGMTNEKVNEEIAVMLALSAVEAFLKRTRKGK